MEEQRYARLTGKADYDKETALWCAVAVRGDLPPGLRAAQAIHAAMASAERFGVKGARLVALETGGADLSVVASRLDTAGVRYEVFEEPDHGLGPTALATEPVGRRLLRGLRGFPLMFSDG